MVRSRAKRADEKRDPRTGRRVVNHNQYFHVGISTFNTDVI